MKKLLFLFAFVYLALYNFPSLLYYLHLHQVEAWYARIWRPLVPWVAEHVLNVTLTTGGGGDSLFAFVQIFCLLVISLAAALLWTLLDRRRRHYARLYEWLRVYLRFVLAVIMIEYGAWKVFPSQFLAPDTDRLIRPFGDFSPMELLWAFMGSSVAYNVFAGLTELAGGLLLTLRRTTLLGALVSIGAMSNVVMLNLGYDVTVKQFSTHLLLMAVFLAAHDARRLVNLFVLNRRATPEEVRPLFRRRWLARTAAALAAVFILYETGTLLYGSYRDVVDHGREAASRSPLYGMWTVEELVVDGEVRPPLVTDEKRWRRVFFTMPGRFTIQLMSDSQERYNLVHDEEKRTLLLTQRGDRRSKTTLVYQQPQPEVLFVEGPVDGHQVRARLRLTEPPEFPLVTRSFHWINEHPFNR